MTGATDTVTIEIAASADALRTRIAPWREEGMSIGFVPTMGALHRGHLKLVQRATELCQRVVVSIFVNPTQFGPDEDFSRYPRDPQADAAKLAAAGCDLLFLPELDTIYPPGHSTFVEVEALSTGLEGDERPGHFRGVATVVTQLLNLVRPDLAVFGEKDAQQLAVVRRLVRDLHLPVDIEAVPTVRESDGLALSSRNAYLSASERRAAPVLYRALTAARELIEGGERSAQVVRETMCAVLATEPALHVDYADVVDAASFAPIEYLRGSIVLPVAGRIGDTRLLDNLHLEIED